jgi:hypothetical protein
MIQHELLNETCNNLFITWLAVAGVGNMISLYEMYVHSLPKSCDFKLRIRLKFGQLCVNNISQMSKTSLGLGWKEVQASAPHVPVEG